jgi:hypothetical protein
MFPRCHYDGVNLVMLETAVRIFVSSMILDGFEFYEHFIAYQHSFYIIYS